MAESEQKPSETSSAVWVGEDRRQNQFFLVIEKCFFHIFHLIVSYTCLTLHYIILPYIFVYEFVTYAVSQSWRLMKAIYKDIKEFFHIIPMSTELVFWFYIIIIEIVLHLKKREEIREDIETKIYKPLQKILKMFNVFPLKPEQASALYSVLKRLPIFGETIPFPSFFFDHTFKRVTFKEGLVTIVPQESMRLEELSEDSFTEDTRDGKSLPSSSEEGVTRRVKAKTFTPLVEDSAEEQMHEHNATYPPVTKPATFDEL